VSTPPKIGQPRFLSRSEVLTLHRASLDAYGGVDGILNEGALDSSLAQPGQGFGGSYAHAFPFEMAAAYGFHLAMNHCFRDGNKRTAFAAMVVFLRMNGWNFALPDEQAGDLMLELIEQRRDKAWLATEVEKHSRPRPSMELRDFFAMFSPGEEHLLLDAYMAGTRSERMASADEAARAIPVIRHHLNRMDALGQEGKPDQGRILAARVSVLVSIYRLAEDMGYEW
jgi:death on curing protein